jgi:Na+/melibiose symporter-like transporter
MTAGVSSGTWRIRRVRDACVLVYIAMGLLVLTIVLIAAAIPDSARTLAYTALALVVAGVITNCAAIVIVTRVMTRSANALTYETKRTDELGLPMRLSAIRPANRQSTPARGADQGHARRSPSTAR